MSDFHCAKFKSDIACYCFKVLFVFFLLFVSFLKVFDWSVVLLFVKNLCVSVDGFIHIEIQAFSDCSFKGDLIKAKKCPRHK